jgi:Uma2 family endonuclease
LVEVADSSLDFDSTVKLALYAQAGIQEVWIIDLTADLVLVHRRPSGGAYASVVRVRAPEALGVGALPGPTIPVASIFAWNETGSQPGG